MPGTGTTWSLAPARSAEELAKLLKERIWTRCTAFFCLSRPEYVFLNLSRGEKAPQEFAAVKLGPAPIQVEVFVVTRCSELRLLRHIRLTLAGRYDDAEWASPVDVSLERLDVHLGCRFCAAGQLREAAHAP